jgi:hypothetical protein
MDELIEAYIEPHPAKTGFDNYRLKRGRGWLSSMGDHR